MEEANLLYSTLSFLFLLTVSTFSYILSKKINFPYTVLLVIVWLFLVPLSKIQGLSFINDFTLTPELLFFVFLPVLLFESAYNINYRELIQNWRAITALSVVWLLISTFLIWTSLYYIFPFIWLEVPFLVTLLFGSLISATDPVAVLALFKVMWAPKRLALIFEWESLFNDWTSYALFLVILGLIWATASWVNFWVWVIWEGLISMLSMIFWGVIFWVIAGLLFSKIIGLIKNSQSAEITLTMILAHLTFIISEYISSHVHIWSFDIQISWIISTTIASIIIWNYGRYKISPKVEAHMEKFWSFFAFISNSLVFILLWLTLSHINADFTDFILPIWITILVVAISRAVSVYLPIWILNKTGLEEKVHTQWQHLLAWGSLRWALALVLVLLVPEDLSAYEAIVWWNYPYTIKEFLIVITISSIFFTLLFKATTLWWMIKKMWVSDLNPLEKFQQEVSRVLVYGQILNKLDKLKTKGYITQEEYDILYTKYEIKVKEAKHNIEKNYPKDNTCNIIHTAISLYALWIEKQALKELFEHNEIDEKTLKFIMHKIDRQSDRLECGQNQIKNLKEKNQYDFFEKFVRSLSFKRDTIFDKYVRNRTKIIVTNKVVRELNSLKEIDFGFDDKIFENVIALYQNFNNIAKEKVDNIYAKNNNFVVMLDAKLVDKSLLNTEEKLIKQAYSKSLMSQKLYLKFCDNIENEIYKDIK